MGIFEAFQVHNPRKHSDPSVGYQGSKNTTGSGTMYMYAKEYREPDNTNSVVKTQGMSNDPAQLQEMMNEDERLNKDKVLMSQNAYMGKMMGRRGSDSSVESDSGDHGVLETHNSISTIDWTHMSQNEFKRLYESLRVGQPDNRVNK